jgi:FMN-dependent NADH-azoreductase
MKLLEIQSSPRGESSDSIALTQSFIEACKSGSTSIVVDTLNVWHEGLGTPRKTLLKEAEEAADLVLLPRLKAIGKQKL